jgi:FkbM family methyltransferase
MWKLLNIFSKKKIITTSFLGIKIKLISHNKIENKLFLNHEELPFINEISRYLNFGDIIYDIGCHSGYHSLHFACGVGSKGQVYAIDANPSCFTYLQENIKLNPKLSINPILIAVSDEVGSMKIKFDKDPYSKSFQIDKQSGCQTADIVIETIDNLADNLNVPNALKIDVEGAEDRVLKGAIKTMKNPLLRMIAIEWHLDMIPGGIEKIKLLRNELRALSFNEEKYSIRRNQAHAIYYRK